MVATAVSSHRSSPRAKALGPRPSPRVPALVLCELGETGLPTHESYSPFCLKVHRALRALDLPYSSRHGNRPAAFRSLNPAGQVPVLLVGDEPVADSTAIVARLVALSPGVLDRDLDDRGRAEAWAWEEFADSVLNGFLVAARWADDRNWPIVREAYFRGAPWFVRRLVAPMIRRRVLHGLVARDVWRAGEAPCWERFEVALDRLEGRAPGDGFWLGDTLGTADLSLFAQLHSFRTALTRWQADRVAARTRLTAYLDRVDRTSSKRAAVPMPYVGPFSYAV